jgi:hypothetical protein
MQNVWILIKKGYLQEGGLHCPSDDRYQARVKEDPELETYEPVLEWGWTSPQQFSYGIQWPYQRLLEGDRNAAVPFDDGLNGSVVIFADRNPGGAVTGVEPGETPPSNHQNSGTSYLQKGGHAGFWDSTTNSNAGYKRDEIYHANNKDHEYPRTDDGPKYSTDTYIVPHPNE